jgi:DENN domain-containing protein 2
VSLSGMEKSVAQFCFPDTSSFPRSRFAAETFSFVLTESDGDRRYGYCRRLLQPGSGKRYPRCFCVLSFLYVTSGVRVRVRVSESVCE